MYKRYYIIFLNFDKNQMENNYNNLLEFYN